MNTAVVNVKIDPNTKSKAQKIAEELGLSLSSIINGYLKQLIRTKKVSFEISEEELELSDWAKKMLERSEENRKAGKYIAFDNPDDALAYLDTIIQDAPAKKKSRVR